MTVPVSKYRMFVQARTDLTEDEVRRYLASKTWPWRDTGEFVYARRVSNAKAFYAALKGIKPPIKVKAEKVNGWEPDDRRCDVVAMRAWRGFQGVMGTIRGAADEVRHYASGNLTACGLAFSECWPSIGKPECPTCLTAAVEQHPEMRRFL